MNFAIIYFSVFLSSVTSCCRYLSLVVSEIFLWKRSFSSALSPSDCSQELLGSLEFSLGLCCYCYLIMHMSFFCTRAENIKVMVYFLTLLISQMEKWRQHIPFSTDSFQCLVDRQVLFEWLITLIVFLFRGTSMDCWSHQLFIEFCNCSLIWFTG